MIEKELTIEKKKYGIAGMTFITVMGILLVMAGIIFILRQVGKYKLTTSIAGTVRAADLGEVDSTLPDNQILYQGRKYELNEDLVTILVMGIDKETVTTIGGQSWIEEEDSQYAGGQADALFLLLLNPHNKNIYLIAINRNTMTEVDVWDEAGNYMGEYIKQIALQHGYGDGGVLSCERQVKTVSRLFHGIPIGSYAAISMDAIPELNDAVGGITVEVLDDIIYPEYDMDFHQGDTVRLYGEKAYWYVRLRNEDVFNSNGLRQNRQMQYLTTFIVQAKNQSIADIRVAYDLYGLVQKYMVTDIDLSSFTYLVTEAVGYDFSVENMYSLQGEVMQGNNFEEFYVDDEALQELIVELFYEPVE